MTEWKACFKYYLEILKESFRAPDRFTLIVSSVLSLVIGDTIAYYWVGRKAASRLTMENAAYGLFPILIFTLTYFIPRLTITPFRKYSRLKAENTTLRQENEELKDPGFDVEFDCNGDSFYHYGNTRFSDGEHGAFELYRIAINNHHVPQNISASVVKIEGADEFKDAVPLPLQFQHDHTASERSIRLIAQQRIFIDVVQLASSTTKPYALTIQSTVTGWRNRIIRGDHFKLKIEVYGEKAKVSRCFEVKAGYIEGTGRMFHMHEIGC